MEDYLVVANRSLNWANYSDGYPVKSYALLKESNPKEKAIYIATVCLNLNPNYPGLFNFVQNDFYNGVNYSVYELLVAPENEGVYTEGYMDWGKAVAFKTRGSNSNISIHFTNSSLIINGFKIYYKSKFKVRFKDGQEKSYILSGDITSYIPHSCSPIFSEDYTKSFFISDTEFDNFEEVISSEPIGYYHTKDYIFLEYPRDIKVLVKEDDTMFSVPKDAVKPMWMYFRTLKGANQND